MHNYKEYLLKYLQKKTYHYLIENDRTKVLDNTIIILIQLLFYILI